MRGRFRAIFVSEQPATTFWPRAVRFALVALIVPACLLLLPSRARAGCGDHVTLAGESASPVPTEAPPDPAPCPHCTRAPAPLQAPSAPAPTPSTLDGALVAGCGMASPEQEAHHRQAPQHRRVLRS